MVKEKRAIFIGDYLDSNLIHFMNAPSREASLDLLIDLLDKRGKLHNRSAFREAIYKREELASTGIGRGIALPHARLDKCEDFFIAVGIHQGEEGLAWDTIDGMPVRLIFLIGGPEKYQTAYLKLLSQITLFAKNEAFLSNILHIATEKEAMDLMQACLCDSKSGRAI